MAKSVKRRIKIVDGRKVDAVSGKPVGEKNNLTAEYDADIIEKIILSAKKHGIDPYTALSIGLQETQLGSKAAWAENPLHLNTADGENENIDASMKFLVDKLKYAKKLGKVKEDEVLQSWNGYGKAPLYYDEAKFEKHIEDNKIELSELSDKELNKLTYQFSTPTVMYGKTYTKENPLDMNKEPVYGRKVIDLRDNIIKPHPEIKSMINSIYGGEPVVVHKTQFDEAKKKVGFKNDEDFTKWFAKSKGQIVSYYE